MGIELSTFDLQEQRFTDCATLLLENKPVFGILLSELRLSVKSGAERVFMFSAVDLEGSVDRLCVSKIDYVGITKFRFNHHKRNQLPYIKEEKGFY